MSWARRSWKRRMDRFRAARRGPGAALDQLARRFEAEGGAEVYEELFEQLVVLELMQMEVPPLPPASKRCQFGWVGGGLHRASL
jgi:hypothetical protein